MILFLSACGVKVLNVPKNQAFVFDNKIILKQDDQLTKDEKIFLKQQLPGQLDDSLKVVRKTRNFAKTLIKNPKVFDTSAANRTKNYMLELLHKYGYFRASVQWDSTIVSNDNMKKSGEFRTVTTFTVSVGAPYLIDTIAQNFRDSNLNRIANASNENTFLKKNNRYSYDIVNSELNRFLILFKNNGYAKLTNLDVIAFYDTASKVLFNPNLSDLERVFYLSEMNNKQPGVNIFSTLVEKIDTNKLKQYYVGQVTIYPDYYNNLSTQKYTDTIRKVIIKYNENKFRKSLLLNNNFLKKGELFNQQNYFRTLNQYNQLGLWQITNIQQQDSTDTIAGIRQKVININLFLTPAKKHVFSGNLETGLFQQSVIAGSFGNILGFTGNLNWTNRNFLHSGINFSQSVRAGVEYQLKPFTTNSFELGYSATLSIPKFIFPFKAWNKKEALSRRTLLTFSLSNNERFNLFRLNNFGLIMGYEWRKTKNFAQKIQLHGTYSKLFDTTAIFNATLQQNPFLRYSFNSALVLGFAYGIEMNLPTKNNRRSTYLRIYLEESGLFFGTLKKWSNNPRILSNLSEYAKLEIEYKHSIILNPAKSSINFRLFAGVGIPNVYGRNATDSALPFFKQFFGGGPNSLRAWPLRGIGPGARPFPSFNERTGFNDRTGDIMLEGNIEYRYTIAQLFPGIMTLRGTFFADVGNIWLYKNYPSNELSVFNLRNFYQQLGVSAGPGLIMDFDYFKLRFDFGFRFKRPDISDNNGWQWPKLNLNDFFNDKERRYENYSFNFGINYAF